MLAQQNHKTLRLSEPDSGIRHYSELLTLSPEQLRKYDIAELNLLCGSGLNGMRSVNIEKSLKLLDSFALIVKREIERNWHRWKNNPEAYNNSLAYFKMGLLITVIQEDYGAHYCATLIPTKSGRVLSDDAFFKDASNIFLHGLLSDKKQGTCSSMPVLYVAVARRLGFPVYLVTTKAHLFCRWEGSHERLNFEGAGEGLACKPDVFYTTWPHKLSPYEIKNSTYLKNLTPQQELALFLKLRSNCLLANQRRAEALVATTQALQVAGKSGFTGLIESLSYGKILPPLVLYNLELLYEKKQWMNGNDPDLLRARIQQLQLTINQLKLNRSRNAPSSGSYTAPATFQPFTPGFNQPNTYQPSIPGVKPPAVNINQNLPQPR